MKFLVYAKAVGDEQPKVHEVECDAVWISPTKHLRILSAWKHYGQFDSQYIITRSCSWGRWNDVQFSLGNRDKAVAFDGDIYAGVKAQIRR